MKTSLCLVLTLVAMNARAEMSMSGTSNSAAPATNTTSLSMPTTSGTTTSLPQAGTSAGSPQTAGPLNSPPNGAGGTYGYPNNAIDPNTVNPGLPQQPYFGGPYYNFGEGTVSGTTTSPNPMGAPFVTPPEAATPSGFAPAVPSGVPGR